MWHTVPEKHCVALRARDSFAAKRKQAATPHLACAARGQHLAAELLKIDPAHPDPVQLRYAAHFLERGCVLAVPTDTVYGLAADPFNLAAIDEIFHVKGRPEVRGLPILVNSMDMAQMLARSAPQNFLRLAKAFWPGALTLVVDASHRVPLKVTANTRRIALRWPHCKVLESLIDEFGGPVTGTSANISGHPVCPSADDVLVQLGARLPLVLDAGETGATLASTIVELHGDTWKIAREGAITAADIQSALG